MGRCYEFGVSIREGCEHAMVVPDEGGRCDCVGCGTSCPGRFKGCVTVISQPGYVPSTAPAWSLRPGDGLESQPDIASALVAVEEPAVNGSAIVARESAIPLAPPPLEVVVDLVEDVAKQISARDSELAALFDRFVDEFRGLRQRVEAQSRLIEELEQRLVGMGERLDTIVSASLLGPLRRDD